MILKCEPIRYRWKERFSLSDFLASNSDTGKKYWSHSNPSIVTQILSSLVLHLYEKLFLSYSTVLLSANIIIDLVSFLGFIDDGSGTVANSRSNTRYLSLFSLCIIIFSQIQISKSICIYYFVSICVYNILCFR